MDMKKIILAIAALAACALGANAQSQKTPAAAKAAVEKAVAAAENPKTAEKPATWYKLAQAYLDAYNAPSGNLLPGTTLQELQIYGFKEKASNVEAVEVGGQPMEKHTFADKNLYFNQNGQLVIIEITKPVIENCLQMSYESLAKAVELDVKGAKLKDYKALQEKLSQLMTQEAYDAYSLQDLPKAAQYFELAAGVSAAAPLEKLDTNCLYNAAFLAYAAQDYSHAKDLFEQCYAVGYYYEDGEVFAKLADIASKQGDAAGSIKYLEDGFVKFPQSQSILIGLINAYMSDNGNTDRLFELLNAAKVNEPNNASLYYVEGNINAQLGRTDAAVLAYEKCAEINPAYEYGYIGEGQMFYNLAVAVQEKAANEMDDAKYMKLVEEFEAALKGCIAPFEKAFEITQDGGVKVAVAEYLKNACFRFRTESQEMSEKYKKYDSYVAANK